MDLTTITPSPAALKALAHPVRLRILALLRLDGPATATALATRLGLNSGATSYHLRHLAQHGFIVDDAERGNGRDRWWKAAHQATSARRAEPAEAEQQEALDAFLQSVAVVQTESLQRAVEERPLLPPEWRAASEFSDWVVRLTPARARALADALLAVMADVDEDQDVDAAEYLVQVHAFPFPGRLGQEPR